VGRQKENISKIRCAHHNLIPGCVLKEQISILLIIGLLLLRFAAGWLPGLLNTDPSWLRVSDCVLSFLLIASLIYLNKDRLGSFNFDKLAIIILLFFIPLQTILLPLLVNSSSSILAFPHFLSWITILISVIVFLLVRKNIGTMPNITARNWKWALGGAVCGVTLSILIGILIRLVAPMEIPLPKFDYTLFLAFPYQLGFAAAYEEPLYRGFLWGELKRTTKWKTAWIILFQAIIFMLAHGVVFLAPPQYPAFLVIFLAGIVFGLLVFYSRSITASMTAHAFYNSFGLFTAYIINWQF